MSKLISIQTNNGEVTLLASDINFVEEGEVKQAIINVNRLDKVSVYYFSNEPYVDIVQRWQDSLSID